MRRRRGVLLSLAAAVAIVVFGVRKISHEHKRVQHGYQLNEARQELRLLEKQNRRLRLEYSVLVSPERIGALASSLGMRPPEPAQLRVADRDQAAPRAAQHADGAGQP